jgi:hypothetical protein
LSDDFARVVGLQFTREFLKGKFEFLFFSPTLFRIFHLFFCVEIFFLGLFFCLVFLRTSCIYILYTYTPPPQEREERREEKRDEGLCADITHADSLSHIQTHKHIREKHTTSPSFLFFLYFLFPFFRAKKKKKKTRDVLCCVCKTCTTKSTAGRRREEKKKKKKKIEGVKCCSKRMSCFVVYIRILKGKKRKVSRSVDLFISFFLIDLLIVAQNEFITKK